MLSRSCAVRNYVVRREKNETHEKKALSREGTLWMWSEKKINNFPVALFYRGSKIWQHFVGGVAYGRVCVRVESSREREIREEHRKSMLPTWERSILSEASVVVQPTAACASFGANAPIIERKCKRGCCAREETMMPFGHTHTPQVEQGVCFMYIAGLLRFWVNGRKYWVSTGLFTTGEVSAYLRKGIRYVSKA